MKRIFLILSLVLASCGVSYAADCPCGDKCPCAAKAKGCCTVKTVSRSGYRFPRARKVLHRLTRPFNGRLCR